MPNHRRLGRDVWKSRSHLRCESCGRPLTPLIRKSKRDPWRPADPTKRNDCSGVDCDREALRPAASRDDGVDGPPMLHRVEMHVPGVHFGAGFAIDGIEAFIHNLWIHRGGPVKHLVDMTDAEIATLERQHDAKVVLRAGPIQRRRCAHHTNRGWRCRASPEPGRLFCAEHWFHVSGR